MTPDPKLVEALDRLEYLHELAATTCEDNDDGELVDGAASVVRDALLSRVQLPEEPSGWVTPENAALIHNSDDVETVVIDRHPGGNLPVYILPGEALEATDET